MYGCTNGDTQLLCVSVFAYVCMFGCVLCGRCRGPSFPRNGQIHPQARSILGPCPKAQQWMEVATKPKLRMKHPG